MDVKQLKYFQAIVDAGNISSAAKLLFMTQPSLSQQLKLLEDDLNVKLVERGSRKITLTEAGQLLYERSLQLFEFLHNTAAEIKDRHEGYRGTLHIGAIASAGATLLPSLIREFHQKYPHIKFQFWEGNTPRILELLDNGLIEIGIIRSAFDTDRYHYMHLEPDPMVVAMSPDWKFNSQDVSISFTELLSKPLLLHRSNETMIADCCQSFGFEPYILCIGDDVRSLLSWAAEGIGLAIVPKSALSLVSGSHLTVKNIIGSPLEIKKSVIWVKQKFLSSVAKHFLTMLFSRYNQSL